MNAKLIINGKEFDIEISDSNLQELIAHKKNTGYEMVEQKEKYYFVDEWGNICNRCKSDAHEDDLLHVIGNCYSCSVVAENNARADKLMRQLRKFAVEHREKSIDYNQGVCEICYNYGNNTLNVEPVLGWKYFGAIPFNSEKVARLAMDTFRDELIWYFTAYKDSL